MEEPTPSRSWVARFALIWAGQQFSLIGSSLAQFSLVWWLTQTTGSATVLATASLVAILPGVVLGPFVGALVDRWNRRIVMIVADSVVALAAAWVVYLFWSGTMQVWHIYVLMFVRAIGGGFHWPAMQASTSLLVPEQHLQRVAGLNQTVQGAVSIAAPPLGALLLNLLPLHGVMAVDVATALLAILPLCFLAIPQPQRSAPVPVLTPRTLWSEAREGLLFLWSRPGVMMLLSMATVINLVLGPAFTLLPLLVTKEFGGGVWHLGALEAFWGAGLVLGGLVLGIWGGFRRRVYTTLLGLTGMGVATVVIGSAPTSWFKLAVVAMFVTGVMNALANGPIMALFQTIVPHEMQGRVFTAIQSVASAMSPLGLLVAGPVADLLGVRSWYLVGGAVCALMGVVGYLVPEIVHIEDRYGKKRAASSA